MLCRRLALFTHSIVAIGGSKFKAVNNRDRNFTATKMKRRLEQIEESFERTCANLTRLIAKSLHWQRQRPSTERIKSGS